MLHAIHHYYHGRAHWLKADHVRIIRKNKPLNKFEENGISLWRWLYTRGKTTDLSMSVSNTCTSSACRSNEAFDHFWIVLDTFIRSSSEKSWRRKKACARVGVCVNVRINARCLKDSGCTLKRVWKERCQCPFPPYAPNAFGASLPRRLLSLRPLTHPALHIHTYKHTHQGEG